LSAIGLLPGEGKWFIRGGWGKSSKKPLQGEAVAHRVNFTTPAPAILLARQSGECIFHLRKKQSEGGAPHSDPSRLFRQTEAAL
jgi:hypothetical protein